MSDPDVQAMLRELGSQIEGRFEALGERLDETREDAREARDGVMRLTERIGNNDTPTQLERLRSEMKEGFKDARNDLINTSNDLRRKLETGHDDHEKRIKALEAFKQKVDGATGFVGWMAKNTPWLVAIAAAALAAVGWKGGAG